ncbi:MAG TPA: hypothetical protein VE693_05465 [Gaiellaceae bacterium]|nr:hypothetical protein [Gaiellaceae bacterium]
MTLVGRFGRFWWNFIVGDDWRAALGIAVAFGVSALLVAVGVPAWWLLPLAAVIVLADSLRRATRRGTQTPPPV